jgi:hypothetical protein
VAGVKQIYINPRYQAAMTRALFGRKVTAVPPTPPPPGIHGNGGGDERGRSARMPWKDTADEIAGNLAFAHLTENLPIRLTVDGRLHAETLLAAAGAVCGYCCQRAVLDRIDAGERISEDRLLTLRGANGHNYFAGDALNEMFYGGTSSASPPAANLWCLMNGTAVGNGLPANQLPTSSEILGPMAETLGQAGEGCPSTGPKHQPLMPVHDLLNIIWPLVSDCLQGRFGVIGGRAYPAPVRIWPAVSAWEAVQCFGKMLPVLDPRVGLLIVMQSAAFASKLNSKRVEAS